MRKLYILFLLVILFFSAVTSCHKPTEQKETDIDFFPSGDTVYTNAQDSIYTNPMFSREILKQALETRAAKDNFNWYKLYTLYIKTYIITSEFDTIPSLCNHVREYCAQAENKTPHHYCLLYDISNILGNRYGIASVHDSAQKYYNDMLKYAKLAQNRHLLIIAYNNMADVNLRTGDYGQCAYYYQQALLVADSINAPQNEFIPLYTGLGLTYMELRNYDMSEYYLDKAYGLFDQMDLNDKFIYYSNRGNMYYYKEDYPQSLKVFMDAYALIADSPDFSYAQNLCNVNIGELYMLMGKLDSAQYYLDKGYHYFKLINNPSAIYHSETQLLELALLKGNITEATRIMQKALDISIMEPSLLNIRKKYLQHYYEKTNNYEKAYQYLKEYRQMDDSIRNDRVKMQVAEIDLRYKQDTTLMKQTIFIQKQQSNVKSLELSVIIWISICIIVLIIGTFLYFYQKKQRAYMAIQHRNRIIGLRMENIRNRVSPHFIFNTLNQIISGYSETDVRYNELFNLIKLLRLNLKLTEKLCITLEEELDFVRTYLNIEQKRFDSALQIQMNIAENIETNQILLPSMMIQIPVENAIKHGLRNKDGEKKLSITVTKEGDVIIINVADNGSGFYKPGTANDRYSTGTGLKVITQTIQLLNTYNNKPITLAVTTNPDGNDEYPGCLIKFIIPEKYSYCFQDEK